MSPKWLIFFFTVWVCGVILGTTLEGAFVGAGQQSILNTLLNCKILTSTTILGKITGAFTDIAMWGALAQAFIWDFSFWEGPLEYVRWILFLPVSIGIIFSIITAWIRGVGGA